MAVTGKIRINRRTLARSVMAYCAHHSIRVVPFPAAVIPANDLVIVAGEVAEWLETSPDVPSRWVVRFHQTGEMQELSKGAFTFVDRVHPADQERARKIVQQVKEFTLVEKEDFVREYVGDDAARVTAPERIRVTVGEAYPGDLIVMGSNVGGFREHLVELLRVEWSHDGMAKLTVVRTEGRKDQDSESILLSWEDTITLIRKIRD
jgi:hypothetical protein